MEGDYPNIYSNASAGLFQSTPSHGGRLDRAIQFWCNLNSFNPRPHMEGDKSIMLHVWHLLCFNPRPHMEGDLGWMVFGYQQLKFQSTPSHGGRLEFRNGLTVASVFQSTPSHGGRPGVTYTELSSSEFQSTPSHGGRHNDTAAKFVPIWVSIHALTWRATLWDDLKNLTFMFQSTPSHGGRLLLTKQTH